MGGRETVIEGIGASPGIAIGRAYLIDRSRVAVPQRQMARGEIPREVARFRRAVDRSKAQLQRVRRQTARGGAKELVHILDTNLMLLEDAFLGDETIRLIRQEGMNAEWALATVLQRFERALATARDSYLRERKADVRYIGERVLRNLVGHAQESIAEIRDQVIIVAHDLAPSDTALMHRGNVLGFVTDIGSQTSHTAIMARALEIPAVVGLERVTREVRSGDLLIVDGTEGKLLIRPRKPTVAEYLEKKERYEILTRELLKYIPLPAETKDGFRVRLAANVELPAEISSVIEHGAEGIGLYRTEYLYMNRRTLPTEEEHFEVYRQIVEGVAPHPATIRTMDIGGDKFLSPVGVAKEINPALGLRAIRFCLREVGIFKAQLRGLLRASVHGNLRIMFPMISGVSELRQARAILEEVKGELLREGHPFDKHTRVGIMIEIPSAAVIADILAREVDFFSIGTNDLIQYALAIDRVNEHVHYLYEPLHPAILRIIRQVVEAGRRAGIEVAMCGEMAGDPLYLPVLLGLGFDELSMNAVSVPVVKGIIRSMTYREARTLAEEILGLPTAAEIEAAVRERVSRLLTPGLQHLIGWKKR
ncbi:MAG: phosphoenolpyruvate--protein phosphotransferase [Deltaproteobacteria bacterium]|nr:phosphoenolpyruvate--protein phosphotransferase [Deltaproteobacteria bacterium]